jgi:hypothetical protein
MITESWHIHGWCGPLAALTNASPTYRDYRTLIESCSARIAGLEQVMAMEAAQHDQAAADGEQQQQGESAPAGRRPLQQRRRRGAPPPPPRGDRRAFMHDQRQRLIASRRAMSHELLASIQRSYATADCSGRPLDLLGSFLSHQQRWPEHSPSLTRAGGFLGFPAGGGRAALVGVPGSRRSPAGP